MSGNNMKKPGYSPNANLNALQKQLEESREEIRRLNKLVSEAERFRAQVEGARDEKLWELARLANLIVSKEIKLSRALELNEWFQRYIRYLQDRPKWWILISPKIRRKVEYKALSRAQLFDADAYLEANPDVQAARMDPLYHFMKHGISEGRLLAPPSSK